MKENLKQLYLILFSIRFKLNSLFIKQNDNTILFISEFPYTLDALKAKYPLDHFIKFEIDPNEDSIKKQIKYMCKAKYIYTDNYNVFMPYISKKKIKIQVWHAPVAVKKIGFLSAQTPTDASAQKRYQKVYDSYNYYICPSQHMEEVFINSFNISKEKILDYGYLKLDYYLSKEYKNKLNQYEKDLEDLISKLNIVYLPTFRKDAEDNKEQINFVNKLVESFGQEYNVWYKLHKEVNIDDKCNGKVIYPKDLEFILKYADIVITDYSSIYIEALMNNSALIYYLYDIDNYKSDRGLNINIADMPGKKAYKYETVYDIISNKKYQKLSIDDLDDKYIPYNLKEKNSEVSIKIIKKLYQ